MQYVNNLRHKTLATLGLVGMVTLLAACGASAAAKMKAADSLACAKNKVTFEGVDQYGKAAIATGCGKQDVIAEDDSGKLTSLRERAAFEMTCAAGDLEMTVIDSTTYGLTGCNRRIVYKYNRFVGFVVQTASEQAPPSAEAPAAEPPAAEPEPVAAAEPPPAAAEPGSARPASAKPAAKKK